MKSAVRPMRVLFDMVHPANSLVFHHSIAALQREGAEVKLASRHKDVLIPLLDEMGFQHTAISTAGRSRAELAAELAIRDLRLWKMVRQFQPDVMVGFGGVAISHVGKLSGVPSISFYDTEHARLQISLALPFITEWHVPSTWEGQVAPGRTRTFQSGKQFAYLHPEHFKPSKKLAIAAGLDPAKDNFLLRTVSWTANHDHGRSGIPEAQLRRAVEFLCSRGKVHISAEGRLPDDLEVHRYRGTPLQFHHLLAHCRLHCGESVTIASEAVMLGVPALLQNDKEHCYITEQQELGLIYRFGPDVDPIIPLKAALAKDPAEFAKRARAFASGSGDLNEYILAQVRRLASTYRLTS